MGLCFAICNMLNDIRGPDVDAAVSNPAGRIDQFLAAPSKPHAVECMVSLGLYVIADNFERLGRAAGLFLLGFLSSALSLRSRFCGPGAVVTESSQTALAVMLIVRTGRCWPRPRLERPSIGCGGPPSGIQLPAGWGYEEPLPDGCRRWLQRLDKGGLVWLLIANHPWHGPVCGVPPEIVGCILVRLLLEEESPILETRIRVAHEDNDWQEPVRFWKNAGLNKQLKESKTGESRSESAAPAACE